MKNKHFFLDPFNLIIEVACFSNILLCILVAFPSINNYFSIYINILSFIGSTLTLYIIKQFFNINLSKSDEEPQENFIELEIPREDRLDEVKDNPGIFLLYGESGIGKTYLLKQFIIKLEENKVKTYYMDNNYFSISKDNCEFLNNYEYIILDQFEKALQYKNTFDFIEKIKKMKTKHIIISFRKEYLDDIFHLLLENGLKLLRLDINSNELYNIKEKLSLIACCSLNELGNISPYADLLKELENGEISFIQLAYICKEIQYKNETYVQEKLDGLAGNYNLVIEDYLMTELNSYEYSQFAYQILYLLCLDPKGIIIHDIIDFQNICIQPMEITKKVVNFLCEQKWIRKIKNSNNIRSASIEQYEISHDFFVDRFSNVCREQLNEEIKSNIEYYNSSFQLQRNIRNDNEDIVNQKKLKIFNKCTNFLNSKYKNIINIGLCLVILWIFISNIITFISKDTVEIEDCLTQIILNIIVSMSIYYVYNYSIHFLRIFKFHCTIVIIFGSLFCVAPFWLKQLWALPMGLAILVTGIIMGCISRKIISKEKIFFAKRARIFSAIGIIVMILSAYFYIYTQGKLLKALPLYLLTIIYMGLTIGGHIDKTYLHGILGKALYGQKYEEDNS